MSREIRMRFAVMPERRRPLTAASVAARTERIEREVEGLFAKYDELVAQRRNAERAAFERDYTPMPVSRWDEPVVHGRSSEDYCEMAPSRYDVVADAEPAGDYSPVPTGRWG